MSRRKKVTPVLDLGVRGLAPDPKSLSDLQPEPDPNHIADEKSAPQTNSKPTGVRRKQKRDRADFRNGIDTFETVAPKQKGGLGCKSKHLHRFGPPLQRFDQLCCDLLLNFHLFGLRRFFAVLIFFAPTACPAPPFDRHHGVSPASPIGHVDTES